VRGSGCHIGWSFGIENIEFTLFLKIIIEIWILLPLFEKLQVVDV
jgi:hypothetical protein